jgi:hypothetical protein
VTSGRAVIDVTIAVVSCEREARVLIEGDDPNTLPTVAGPAKSVSEAIDLLTSRVPDLASALEGVLDELRRQPRTVAEKRDTDNRLKAIGAAFIGVRDAILELRGLAVAADAEHQNMLQITVALTSRIRELEADIKEWQQEYEPDSDPERPAMLSNIRQALHAFSRRGAAR